MFGSEKWIAAAFVASELHPLRSSRSTSQAEASKRQLKGEMLGPLGFVGFKLFRM